MRGIVRGGNNDGKKIELDGTAAVDDVLSGKTFYNDDPEVKRTGTLPNNAGNTAAVSYHRDGTSIHVVPARGFTDGSDDAAIITDADFLASNIKAGFEIFGLTGTLRWQNDIYLPDEESIGQIGLSDSVTIVIT